MSMPPESIRLTASYRGAISANMPRTFWPLLSTGGADEVVIVLTPVIFKRRCTGNDRQAGTMVRRRKRTASTPLEERPRGMT
jgi:hypothetical protein